MIKAVIKYSVTRTVTMNCFSCKYGLVCYNNMMYFADDAIYHINHHLGFAAKEASE